MKHFFKKLELGTKLATFSILSMIIVLALPNLAVAQELTSITLNWTAPGDDGDIGQASEYDVRYSTNPIDSASWDEATQADGEPAPSPAGTVESFTVTGLQPNTTYYFAVKASDDVGNWSGLSNVAMVTTIDNVPPGDIADLSGSAD